MKWVLGWAFDSQVRAALAKAGVELPPMRKGALGTLGAATSLWQLWPVAWRLLRDPRVPRLYKAIPLATLLYVVAPWSLGLDLIPILGEVNSIAAVVVGLTLFIRVAAGHIEKQPQVFDQQTQRWLTPQADARDRAAAAHLPR